MTANQLIQRLQELVKTEGDLPVVTGLTRTGYGEEILKVLVNKAAKNGLGEVEPTLDLVAANEGLVALGGF